MGGESNGRWLIRQGQYAPTATIFDPMLGRKPHPLLVAALVFALLALLGERSIPHHCSLEAASHGSGEPAHSTFDPDCLACDVLAQAFTAGKVTFMQAVFGMTGDTGPLFLEQGMEGYDPSSASRGPPRC